MIRLQAMSGRRFVAVCTISWFSASAGLHAAGAQAQEAPVPIAQQQAAPDVPSQADPAPTAGAGGPSLPVKAASKPVHALTIGAGEPEVARIKALATLLPNQPIRIVKPRSGDKRPVADFTVQAALAAPARTGMIRDAKLFTEQLHVIAGPGVTRIEDLKDRVVSFGMEGAGQDTARKAFQALGITVKETPLDLDNALDGAATGDIDAVVVLAPQPFDRLRGVSRSSLHLLAWPDGGALPEGAVAATIDGGHYPGLAKPGETLRAVGVDAILTASPKAAKLPAAKLLFTAIAQHPAALSKRGFDLLKADADGRPRLRLASDGER